MSSDISQGHQTEERLNSKLLQPPGPARAGKWNGSEIINYNNCGAFIRVFQKQNTKRSARANKPENQGLIKEPKCLVTSEFHNKCFSETSPQVVYCFLTKDIAKMEAAITERARACLYSE